MSVDAYSGLPFQAGQAVATAVGRAAMSGISLYLRAPWRNSAMIALVTLTAMAGSNALYSQTSRHPAPLFGTFTQKSEAAREVPQPLPIVGHEAAPAKKALPLVTNTAASEPVAAASPTPTVSNDDVRAMQEKLTAFGFYSGKADGLFGPKTSKSIRAFEQMLGRPQTGQLTAEIVALIKSADMPAKIAQDVTVTPAPAAATTAQPAAEIVATPVQKVEATLPPPAPLTVETPTTSEPATTVMTKTVAPEHAATTAPAETAAPAAATQPVALTTPAATNADVVKSVQRGLSSLGFLRTEISGVADEATARAIRNFEVYYNYAVSGLVTNELVNLLVQNGAVI